MWRKKKKINIKEDLIQVTEALNKSLTSAVLLENHVEAFFHMTVDIFHWGIHCCLSCSTSFLENSMHGTLHHLLFPLMTG